MAKSKIKKASSRFPLSLGVSRFGIAFAVGVLALLVIDASASGQTSDRQPGSADYCNGLLGALSPECQAAPGALGTSQEQIPGGRVAPGPSVVPEMRSLANPAALSRELTAPAAPELVPGADAPNEFQRFAANSVGTILPIFGASLFQRVPTTFAPNERAPVTADYVIGPGDEILLRVWGQVNLNLELVVDRNGAIYIPQAGNVSVSGLQFKQLPAFLKSNLGRVFRNFDLTVSMGQLRSIQVFVIGQARRPGTYTVSSLSTLVNVLFASGGPTAQGSMRHIQLKRGDAVVSEFDLYDLLLKGDKSRDARLLPGDVVFIPQAGPQVAVAGSIRNAAVFELKDEHTVGELLQVAGGVASTADLKRVVLERVGAGHDREVLELSLDAVGRAVAIREADVLSIRSLSPHFERTVTLRGNVATPGRFAWREGMRLRDIIPDKEALITRDYWVKRNAQGFQPALERPTAQEPLRIAQDDWRRSHQQGRLIEASLTTVDGTAPQDPDGFDSRSPAQDPESRTDKTQAPPQPMTTELGRASPEINWSYAVIERLDSEKLVTQLVAFDLGKLVLQKDDAQNYELQSGDVVTIFSTNDIHVPLAQQSRFVHLEGEFNASGVYLARPGETLGQLIQRAGGLTKQAYLYGAEFLRESTRREQQKRLNQFAKEMEKDLEQEASKRTTLASGAEETAALSAQVQSERRSVEQLKSLQATGRIVLNFDPSDASLTKLMTLALEDGDRFVVPSPPATVNVLGEVYNQNAFLHESKLRVEDYLRNAGGLKRSADKAHIFIIRADGSVVPKHSAGPFSKVFEAALLNPGDSIVVPEEILKVPFVKNLRNWTQVIADLGLGAAAINVLK